MPELIRYRYQPGERYTFNQEIDILVEVPGQPPVLDHASLRCAFVGLERHPDNSVSLELHTQVTSQLTLVAPIVPVVASYRVTRRGELMGADPIPPAFPFAVFPPEPVEVKKAWKSVESIVDRQVAMSHTVGFIEQYEGERVAHLVTEGTAVGEPAIEFFAVRLFGLAKGRPLLQRCVTRYIFSTMGTTLVVVEEKAEN